MRKNKRHFSQEAFLLSTFVEFNKCWSSGKRSRLFIETVNGNAFVNFSVFLGHPGNAHFTPKNPKPEKKKVKSKRKTDRDNERAAKFQEQKRKEMAAAASAAATESSGLPLKTSSPTTKGTSSSSSPEFSFAEPAPENISSDMSDFATMNIDGNVTIPSVPNLQKEASSPPPSGVNKGTQCPPEGGCDAQIQTDKMLILYKDDGVWWKHSEWFRSFKHKVKPGIKQHTSSDSISDEQKLLHSFFESQIKEGVSKRDLVDLWNSNYSENEVLLKDYRSLQEGIAFHRFYYWWYHCRNPKDIDEEHMVPFDQPLKVGFDRGEPCNSSNFDGCLCQETSSDPEFKEEWTSYLNEMGPTNQLNFHPYP